MDFKEARNLIIWAKRAIRTNITQTEQIWSSTRRVGRAIKILETKDSPFNHHKVESLKNTVVELEQERKVLNNQLERWGQSLFKDIVPVYEEQADIYSMAALLNCNHRTIQKIRDKDDEDTSFTNLIFVHHIEVKKRGDFIELYDRDMPLYGAFIAWFMAELRSNRELKKATTEQFDKMFPGIPKYRSYVDWSGKIAMERIPPDLYIVH
jgi:hypothetical protein